MPKKESKKFEVAILWTSMLAALPGFFTGVFCISRSSLPTVQKIFLFVLLAALTITGLVLIRLKVVRPLRTISSMLSAIRLGDFSVRMSGFNRNDVLGEIYFEINEFSSILRQQRLGAVESTALLKTVMAEVDVSLFAFGEDSCLTLINPAGENLLKKPAPQLLGKSADELGMLEFVEGSPDKIISKAFPGGTGRWGMKRGIFREGGLPQTLVLISDITQPLREEEQQAWKRIIRVIGHELNNSLAPMISISESLNGMVDKVEFGSELKTDLQDGLNIIKNRSESLSRFMTAYAQLAKLPAPVLKTCKINEIIHELIRLEDAEILTVNSTDEISIQADKDQLEQAIINLLHNAIYAAKETGGKVNIHWRRKAGRIVEIKIIDDGPGISNDANLFVPFFTTKPEGSGIGLALSRSIIEAHDGTLELNNREDAQGCIALITLPT